MLRSWKGLLCVAGVLLLSSRAGAQQAKGVASPDGKLRAVAAKQAVNLVDGASGKIVRTMLGHSDIVQALAFSPDGKALASGGADNVICLWDLASGRLLAKRRIGAAVTGLRYAANGKTLKARLADNTTQTIDAATGKTISRQ